MNWESQFVLIHTHLCTSSSKMKKQQQIYGPYRRLASFQTQQTRKKLLSTVLDLFLEVSPNKFSHISMLGCQKKGKQKGYHWCSKLNLGRYCSNDSNNIGPEIARKITVEVFIEDYSYIHIVWDNLNKC